MRAAKLFLWLIAITVLVIGLTACSAFFLLPMFFIEQWLGTQALILAYWILGLACLVVMEHGRAPMLMRTAMVIGAVACAAWIAIAWSPGLQNQEIWIKLTIWPTTAALAAMVIGLLLLARLPGKGWIWVRGATIAIIALLGLFIAAAFWFHLGFATIYSYSEIRRYEEVCFRIGAAMGLLGGGGILLTIIGAWLPTISNVRVHAPKRAFWFRCPRCGLEQDASTGTHACGQCGLSIRVELVR